MRSLLSLCALALALPVYSQEIAPIETVVMLTVPKEFREQIDDKDQADRKFLVDRHLTETKVLLMGLGCTWVQEGETVIYSSEMPGMEILKDQGYADIHTAQLPKELVIPEPTVTANSYVGMRAMDAYQLAERRKLSIMFRKIDGVTFKSPLVFSQTKVDKGVVIFEIKGGLVTKAATK